MADDSSTTAGVCPIQRAGIFYGEAMFEKLPKDHQGVVHAAVAMVLHNEEPEMAQMFRELVAEKWLKDDSKPFPTMHVLVSSLTNFSAGWHAHESMVCEMIVAVSEAANQEKQNVEQGIPLPLPSTPPKTRRHDPSLAKNRLPY